MGHKEAERRLYLGRTSGTAYGAWTGWYEFANSPERWSKCGFPVCDAFLKAVPASLIHAKTNIRLKRGELRRVLGIHFDLGKLVPPYSTSFYLRRFPTSYAFFEDATTLLTLCEWQFNRYGSLPIKVGQAREVKKITITLAKGRGT